jgi:predicted transposase YbfD/YdcC
VEKGHGRIETRKLWASAELKGYIDFPYHEQVVRIERITTDLTGKALRHEIVSGITSLSSEKAGPERLLRINREHWGIEDKLHYVRDVTFDEDRCRIRTKSGPRVMATLRNLAIGILRLGQWTNIAQAIRHYGAKQHLTLGLIGL